MSIANSVFQWDGKAFFRLERRLVPGRSTMCEKPTYEELEKELKRCGDAQLALKDYVAYQSVLSSFREALLDKTEEELIHGFLSEILRQYGFCMAWHGRYENGAIRPTVSVGRVDRYLDNLVLRITEPDAPDADCAMSRAILDRVPFSYSNLETDEGFRKWRNYAMELGYRSNLALPFQVDSHIEGGVMIYAETPNAFPKDRIARLEMLTVELGAILHQRRLERISRQALDHSAKTIRALLDATTELVMLVDKDGKILALNKTAADRFEKTPEEAAGLNVLDLLEPEAAERRKAYGEEVIRTGKSVRFRDGRGGRQFDTNVHPIFDEHGRVIHLAVYARDVTDQDVVERMLIESKGRFRQLSEAAFEAVVIHDDGVLLEANDQFFEMFGYTREELSGKNALAMTMSPESARVAMERIASGETKPYEAVGLKKDGTRIALEIRVRLTDYEGRKIRVGVIRDVTLQKQFEKRLLVYQDNLRSLASKLSLAEARERRRIATEVHDHIGQNLAFAKIRLTELRRISGVSEYAGSLQEVVGFIDSAIQDIRSLVSELSPPVLYELGFVPAIRQVSQEILRRHGIACSIEDDGRPKPLGEDMMVLLFQAVRELLINVVKHARASAASLSITRTDDKIRVQVKDNGIGFDVAKTDLNGMDDRGFGLFSIRERLDPLGGCLDVRSELGRGTEVTLWGPLNEISSRKE
jgi:PAS domain S-box-containing protein